MKLAREQFLGGSSGINGTLCIPSTGQDYDDVWGGRGPRCSLIREGLYSWKPLDIFGHKETNFSLGRVIQ